MFGWLTVAWALTFGFVPQLDTIEVDSTRLLSTSYDKAFVVTMEIEARAFDCVRAWGKNETYMLMYTPVSYLPFRGDYQVGFAVYGEGVEVGIWHECDHGILYKQTPDPWFGANETQVYIKFSGRTE